MTKYRVFGLASASTSVSVEANSPKEAAENADLYMGLCYQCADEVELGDVYEVTVYEDNKEVWSDKREDNEDAVVLAEFLKDKKRLPPKIKAIVDRLMK
jgi:hypothetical protein